MSSEDTPDKEDKTEEATQQRIRQSQEKGDFPISKDVIMMIMLSGSFMCIFIIFPFLGPKLASKLRGIIEKAHLFYDQQTNISWTLFLEVMPFFLGMVVIFILCAVAGTYLQTRLTLNKNALTPKFDKISPIKGFKRLASLHSVIELLKSLIKLTAISFLMYVVLSDEFNKIPQIATQPIGISLNLLWSLSFKIFIMVLIVQVFIGMADYTYQRYDYFKRLKMTKKELKEEFKETEGNPYIKSKRRQLQRQTAKNRMLDHVETATVVITNPTHYAIALKYNPLENKAPIIVAKGKGRIAAIIKELALKKWVQIIQNPPLARSLYKLPLNKEIPPEFYKAVAEIIKYVLKKRKQKL